MVVWNYSLGLEGKDIKKFIFLVLKVISDLLVVGFSYFVFCKILAED